MRFFNVLIKSTLMLFLIPGHPVLAHQKAPSKDVVRIYVAGSLTGMMPFLAQGIYQAATLFAELQNKRGGLGGRRVEVVAQDDKNQLELAERNALAAMADPNHMLTLGQSFSSMALPIGRLYQKSKKFFVTAYATNSAIGSIGKYVRQLCFNDDFQGKVLARRILKLAGGANEKIGVLINVGDPYSTGLAESVISHLRTQNKAIVRFEYLYDKIDRLELSNRIKQEKPSVLFFPDLKVRVADLASVLSSSGAYSGPIVGGDGWGSEKGTVEILKNSLLHSPTGRFEFTYHYHPEVKTSKNDEIVKVFRKHNITPYGPAVMTFEFLLEIAKNISSFSNSNISNDLAEIFSDYTFESVTGKVRLTKSSGTTRKLVLLEVSQSGLRYKKLVGE